MSKYTKAVEKEKINQLVSSDAFILGSGKERSEMIETLFEQFETPIENQLPNEDAIRLMAKEWASCFDPPERLGMESANLAGLLRMAWIASDVIKQKEKELTGLFPKGFYNLSDLSTKIKMLLACREAFLNQPNEAMSFAEWASSNEWAFIENKWVELGQADSETLILTTYQLYQLYQSEKAKK